MAFPTAGTPVQTQFALSVTSMAVNMPASVSSGDLLIALVEVRNAGTWTKPTGWSDISTVAQAGGSSVGKLNGFYKIADGSEAGGTATWTTTVGTSGIWQVIGVTGWHGTTPPEGGTSSGDSTTNPDPPSLTPSWAIDDTLWIEVAANSATAALTTGASTNYTGYQANTASSGGAQVNIASATRQLNASSEDPGIFAHSGSIRFWAAATIAVRPAAGGGVTDDSISVNDSSTVTESVSPQMNNSLNVNDISTATENIITFLVDNIVVHDSSTATESITVHTGEGVNINDSSAATENITMLIKSNIAMSDSSTATESITVQSNENIVVNDNSTLSESVSFSIAEGLSIHDASTVTENTISSLVSNIQPFDTVSTSENTALLLFDTINTADSSGVTEVVTLQVPTYYISTSDSSTVSEIVSMNDTLSLVVHDGITVTEVLSTGEFSILESLSVFDSIAPPKLVWVNDRLAYQVSGNVYTYIT